MQTKPIDTKYKEIYYNSEIEQIETSDNSDNQILRMMDLMALQNKAFISICR